MRLQIAAAALAVKARIPAFHSIKTPPFSVKIEPWFTPSHHSAAPVLFKACQIRWFATVKYQAPAPSTAMSQHTLQGQTHAIG
jgi:hypothetical protein